MTKHNRVTIVIMLSSIMLGGAHAAIVISDLNSTYTQDFSSLPSSGTTLTWAQDSTINGWYRNYSGGTVSEPGRDSSVQTTTSPSSGVSSQDGFLNVGVDGTSDRALVMRRAFSTAGAVGLVLENNSGGEATGFTLGYTGEQWRRHGADATSLYLEYAVVSSHDSGTFDILEDYTWTRVSELEFISPRTGGSNTGLRGDLDANRLVIDPFTVNTTVADGEYLAIRWYQDRTNTNGDSSSARHALGINEMSVAMIPEPATMGLLGLPAVALFFLRRLTI